MAHTEYDLVTLGAGGGAYPAAFRLARLGWRVLMVDPKGVMSGNCLAEGCVPSKTVREVARLLVRQHRMSEFGAGGSLEADYAKAVAHKDAVQRLRYDQHRRELARIQNLELVSGIGRILDARTVEIQTPKTAFRVRTGHILIATGADIVMPPIPGAELCLTSHHLFKLSPDLTMLPPTAAVIGGGYVGLETACMMAAFGVRVTLFERSPDLLSGLDRSMVGALLPLLDPAIRILTEIEIRSVEKKDTSFLLRFRHEGQDEHASFGAVILATGRKPVFPDGLETLGIETSRTGIHVNDALQTTHPHIYACGDVNGRKPLFHAAVRQSLAAASNMLAGAVLADRVDFSSIPLTVFTLPAAACVGILPDEARRTGLELIESRYDFEEDSRAQILGETEGGIRLFFDPESLEIRGGWVVGVDAGNLIGEIGLAVAQRLTARDLARFADPHPMASEGIGKAARKLD